MLASRLCVSSSLAFTEAASEFISVSRHRLLFYIVLRAAAARILLALLVVLFANILFKVVSNVFKFNQMTFKYGNVNKGSFDQPSGAFIIRRIFKYT